MADAFLSPSAADRREVLGVAADRSGRPTHLLEKDAWVVWALAALYGSPLGEHLVFKGGTSLSKAYGVIRRFSEDVDLTYDIRALAPDLVGDNGEALPKTRSEEKRWSSEVRKRLPEWVIATTLNFLTGDRWGVYFRSRAAGARDLAPRPTKLRTANPTTVCLFSGGLDSFIGAIDLLARGEAPMLVSHYWDGITSTHQAYCAEVMKRRFGGTTLHHFRARVGFPTDTVEHSAVEDTLRGRSFLFFSLAAMAADAIGGDMVVHVPENGLISLNVPLDPLRLGALSTRTTHPFYMARFEDLLKGLGLSVRLENPYAFMTKGQMAKECADIPFLRKEAKHTMSCSSPGSRRYDPDPNERTPKHCGRCVPCLIRRAAILEGWGTDDTSYRIPDLRAQVLYTNKAEGEHVRSFQLALSRLARKPGRARFDIHRPGPLIDHPGKLSDYEAVYVAGLQEVGRLLHGVQARPL